MVYPCTTPVAARCRCGHRVEKVSCSKGLYACGALFCWPHHLLASLQSSLQSAVSEDVVNAADDAVLACNAKCRLYQEEYARQQRNAALMAGLALASKPVDSQLHVEVEYSDFLHHQAAVRPSVVSEAETVLAEFVASHKSSVCLCTLIMRCFVLFWLYCAVLPNVLRSRSHCVISKDFVS